MNLTNYTTFDDIRAALGVTSDELGDDTLGLDLYPANLEMELEDVDVNLLAAFNATALIAEGTRTDAEKRFYSTTKLFATYAVARQLGAALPLFAPKDVTDGKAAVGRFASNPYKDTLKALEAQYGYVKGKLVAAYAALSAGTKVSVTQIFMGVSSPSSDPVTGT